MTEPNAAGRAMLSVFDRIYVINLEHRTDRRDEMAAQLARLGLGFDHPQVVLFPATQCAAAGGFPSPGVRGCFMSHLRILRGAAQTGADRVLILEDDANFSRHAEARLPVMADALRNRPWEMLYGWHPDRHVAADSAGDIDLVDLPGREVVRMTHFVGMTGATAARIVPYFEAMLARPLGHPEGGPMHVDGAYSWFRAAHPDVVTLVPAAPIAVQRPSRSDIHGSKWFDRIAAFRPVVASLRRMKTAMRAG